MQAFENLEDTVVVGGRDANAIIPHRKPVVTRERLAANHHFGRPIRLHKFQRITQQITKDLRQPDFGIKHRRQGIRQHALSLGGAKAIEEMSSVLSLDLGFEVSELGDAMRTLMDSDGGGDEGGGDEGGGDGGGGGEGGE
jgi:hypothetical protein